MDSAGGPDWRQRPEDWPETRYEAKAIAEARPLVYLSFRRQGDRESSTPEEGARRSL